MRSKRRGERDFGGDERVKERLRRNNAVALVTRAAGRCCAENVVQGNRWTNTVGLNSLPLDQRGKTKGCRIAGEDGWEQGQCFKFRIVHA